VVPAIYGQLNNPDPAWWERLTEITAPTLIIRGGPDSHIPQDKLEEATARLPRGTLQVILAGHHVHTAPGRVHRRRPRIPPRLTTHTTGPAVAAAQSSPGHGPPCRL